MQATEVSGEQVIGVGLVHGAGPDGWWRWQRLVKLVTGHSGDGGVGLGAPAGGHQVPHHLGAVRGAAGFTVLLDNTDNDEDEDEDHNDAKRDDQDQDGGALTRCTRV